MSDEFEQIWEHQKKYYNDLTPNLKQKLEEEKMMKDQEDGILSHQRPLHSQKHSVGNCTFETNKTKCQFSAIPFRIIPIVSMD